MKSWKCLLTHVSDMHQINVQFLFPSGPETHNFAMTSQPSSCIHSTGTNRIGAAVLRPDDVDVGGMANMCRLRP